MSQFLELPDAVAQLVRPSDRVALGITTEGPALLVTDLCMMKPDPVTMEFVVVSVHPASRTNEFARTPAGRYVSQRASTRRRHPIESRWTPSENLNARTARAHGGTAVD